MAEPQEDRGYVTDYDKAWLLNQIFDEVVRTHVLRTRGGGIRPRHSNCKKCSVMRRYSDILKELIRIREEVLEHPLLPPVQLRKDRK